MAENNLFSSEKICSVLGCSSKAEISGKCERHAFKKKRYPRKVRVVGDFDPLKRGPGHGTGYD